MRGWPTLYDRAVELVEARELLEGLRYVSVPHAPARVRASCPAPGSILTHNEAENIEGLVRAALARLETTGLEHTVLVVDDGSPDGTGVIADRLAQELAPVRVLHRERKEGLGRAYLAGFAIALDNGAELVLEMDADFSHDPADLPRLIAAAEDADLVLGSATSPAAASPAGGGCGGSCRAAARPTRAPSWACR